MNVETVNETVVLRLPEQGAPIGTGQDALDLIGQSWGTGAHVVAIPAERFDPAFFDLRSGLAGEFIQKLVNYQLRLAVVGDISVHLSASNALRDFVRESNRGEHVRFVPDAESLSQRLAPGTT